MAWRRVEREKIYERFSSLWGLNNFSFYWLILRPLPRKKTWTLTRTRLSPGSSPSRTPTRTTPATSSRCGSPGVFAERSAGGSCIEGLGCQARRQWAAPSGMPRTQPVGPAAWASAPAPSPGWLLPLLPFQRRPLPMGPQRCCWRILSRRIRGGIGLGVGGASQPSHRPAPVDSGPVGSRLEARRHGKHRLGAGCAVAVLLRRR